MSLLEAQGLRKSYRGRQVVRDVSVSVDRGEVVGLLGPNGAGKTTCFYMIVGLVRAEAGAIRLNDSDITRLPMHSRARLGLGYLPQEPSIFRKLSVADNLRTVIELQGKQRRGAIDRQIEDLLHDFHIGHLADNPAMGLSGGERRRLEIARALATQPGCILLDEPFAGVDPISVVDIQRIIAHLTERDIGVLITDHNVRETLGSCNRAYIINEGEVIAEGSSEEILANQTVREVYLGDEFRL